MPSVLAPQIVVAVNGTVLNTFVSSCTVDRSLDSSTLISLIIANGYVDTPRKARTSELLFTDSLALMPGNVVEVYLGYGGSELEPVGAGIIKKWLPNFPQDQMPTLQLKCFDALSEMMDGNDDVEAMAARRFEDDTSLVVIARQIFNDYGFDISNVADEVTATVSIPSHKKVGTSDYQFVRGIANTIGWEFFVEWDFQKKKWLVFFRPPQPNTEAQQTFTWGPDFAKASFGGNLLHFRPQLVVQGQSTDVEVFYFDRGSKTWEKIVYPETRSSKKKEFEWKGDDTTIEADLQAVGDANSGRGLRIQAGGVSVEVVPATGFRSSEEATQFAKNWWKARQEYLISGAGATIGYPKMQPGQVHILNGLGKGLSGNWYISETRHIFTADGDAMYTTSFVARKVIP